MQEFALQTQNGISASYAYNNISYVKITLNYMIKNRLYLSILLLFLYSCVETDLPNHGYGNEVVTFHTTRTKATETAWENGDKIGVSMVRERAPGVWETVVDDTFNRCYQTSGDGVFTPATAVDIIKAPKDGEAVNFIAYYPYQADLTPDTPCVYPLDLSDQTEQTKTNFMVSRNLEGVKVTGGALTLEFSKPLAKLRIHISSEFDAAQLDGVTVAIHGIKYSKADYMLFDTADKLTNAIENKEAVMAVVSPEGLLAEASLLAAPNTLASGGQFVFTLQDGSTMTHTLTNAINFEAGRRYTYNIRLKEGGATEAYFDVLPRQVADVAIEGATHQLALLSKSAWIIKSKPNWVECSPSYGNGSSLPQELTLTIGINNSNSLLREGEVVFEDANGESIPVSVSQKGYPPIGYEANMRYRMMNEQLPDIVIYPSRNIPAEELRWKYYSSTFWNAKLLMEPSSWINFSYESHNRNYLRPGEQATFNIANNNSSEPREIIIKMTDYDSLLIRVYKIIQLGATDYLEVSQSSFNSRGKGDKFDFVVSSRGEWQVEGVPSWVTLTRGATSANKTPVMLTYTANQEAARNATITFRSGALTQTVAVSQNAKRVQSYPYRLPYQAIIHGFAGEGFKFVGTSQGTNNYANTAEIVVRPGDGTSFEMTKAYGPYGFVVNPPTATEFKSTEIHGKTMMISNYMGATTRIPELEVSINYNGWTYIRRAKIFNLPVPAGLTDEDKLVYTIKMTNITWAGTFDYSVSYEIL